MYYKVESGTMNRVVEADSVYEAVRKSVIEHVGKRESKLYSHYHQPHSPIGSRVKVYETERYLGSYCFGKRPVFEDSIENALASTPETSPKLVLVLVDLTDAYKRIEKLGAEIERVKKQNTNGDQPRPGLIRRMVELVK